jgi:hypothetical protein
LEAVARKKSDDRLQVVEKMKDDEIRERLQAAAGEPPRKREIDVMLDDIVVHDIAQGISIPVSTTQNRLLPPWAGIASRLPAHPTGLALLISKQTFQERGFGTSISNLRKRTSQ